jgi:hypothetical protein
MARPLRDINIITYIRLSDIIRWTNGRLDAADILRYFLKFKTGLRRLDSSSALDRFNLVYIPCLVFVLVARNRDKIKDYLFG